MSFLSDDGGPRRSGQVGERSSQKEVATPLSSSDLSRAILELARLDPRATLIAFDELGGRAKTPPETLTKLFPTNEIVGKGLGFIAEPFHEAFQHSWDHATAYGGSRCRAARAAAPHLITNWSVLDLRAEHGCIVVIVGTAEVELHAEPSESLLPKHGTMKADETSIALEIDDSALAMLGYRRKEIVGDSSLRYLHPDDHEKAVASWIKLLDQPGRAERVLLRYRRASGEYFWAEVTHRNLLTTAGYVLREIVDVSDMVSAVMEAESKDRVIQGLADVLPSGIAQFGPDLRLRFANDRWSEITGVDNPTSKKSYTGLLIEPSDGEALAKEVFFELRTNGYFDTEITLAPADGGPHRRCRLAVRQLRGEKGQELGIVACLDDITESWRLQMRLVEQATTDRLTGLANRNAVLDHLDRVLEGARGRPRLTGVVFIDLNGFKRVNDVLGHAAGDELLREIAHGISSAVRPNDLVARHGGDEFLVVCEDIGSAAAALRVARRVMDAVAGRYRIQGELVEASASCGVAVDVGGTHTAERMIAEADLAMYERKRRGVHDPGLFEPSMFTDQRLELNRDTALGEATEDGSLVLHYQPIVDIGSRETVGYEALLRWRFEGSLVYPDEFIGLAERRGAIGAIGQWVVNEVVATAARHARRDLLWTLNVSPLQLRDGDFDLAVARALEHHCVMPHQIGLELTEGVMMVDNADTQALLGRLDALGVRLLVDDFGTGWASLDYLRTFPVSGLKIDRGFVADLDDLRTRMIVSNVVDLARKLDLRLVVEGIETEYQREVLLETGAVIGQGYLFGRPGELDLQEREADVDQADSSVVR